MTGSGGVTPLLIGAIFGFSLATLMYSSSGYQRWQQRQFWRRKCRESGFRPDGQNLVEIPIGFDRRPGYTISLPSRPSHVAGYGTDLSRNDFLAMVGPATFVNAICFSPNQRHATVEESAETAIRNLVAAGYELTAPIKPTEMAGEPAVVYQFRHSASTLTEWKFKRDGWLFAVGVRSHEPDPESHARALRYLATWRWLPMPAPTE
jgi:hypothetical protein